MAHEFFVHSNGGYSWQSLLHVAFQISFLWQPFPSRPLAARPAHLEQIAQVVRQSLPTVSS